MLAAWAAELTLITLRDMNINLPGLTWKSSGNRVGPLPAPGDYLATFVIFAPLAFAADTQARPLAEALAWGYVLATLLQMIDPSNPTSKPTTTAQPATTQAGTAPAGGGKPAAIA